MYINTFEHILFFVLCGYYNQPLTGAPLSIQKTLCKCCSVFTSTSHILVSLRGHFISFSVQDWLLGPLHEGQCITLLQLFKYEPWHLWPTLSKRQGQLAKWDYPGALGGGRKDRSYSTRTLMGWLMGPFATMYSIPVSYTSVGLLYLKMVPATWKFWGLSTL